jgi:abhydrolase domain-containing protein 17
MNRLIRASANSLMFKPPPRPALERFREDCENVLLKTLGGDYVHCCLVCPYGRETQLQCFDGTARIMIFMHGNADDIESSKTYCKWLADHLQMHVLLFDYPGYGFSSGEPSEEAMEDAAIAVMEYTTTKLRKNASDVFVCGKSIGSYPAVSLAAHPVFANSIRGLILISPVASAARCVFEPKMVPDFLLRRMDSIALANIQHIGNVQTAIFIVHGSKDDVVSIDNAHALMAASSSTTYYPPLFLEAGHNDIECKFGSVVLDAFAAFVAECDRHEQTIVASSPYDGFF